MSQSLRMHQVQAPVIPIVGDLVRGHPGTISLGQGVVHYGPPPEAISAIEDFLGNPENHKYHAVEGIPALRQAIRAKLASENGMTVPESPAHPDDACVCVTAGGNMAFFNVVPAITDPGDEIILLTPYYFNHEMATRIADCVPVLVPTDAAFQPDLERIANAITPRTRAILTVSPNNPTGAVYPEETLRAINEICNKKGLYHIHDEAYEYFVYGGARHFSPGSIPGASGHTISLYSLSKAYGFASWRIGYMVFPDHLAMAIKKIQDTNLICPPVISQFAAIGALSAGKAYMQGWLHEYDAIRTRFLQEFNRASDLCHVPSAQGAFYFFIQVDSNQDEMDLIRALIQRHGVAVMPGQSFGMRENGYFRVAYGALRLETATAGVQRLIHGLRAEKGELQ